MCTEHKSAVTLYTNVNSLTVQANSPVVVPYACLIYFGDQLSLRTLLIIELNLQSTYLFFLALPFGLIFSVVYQVAGDSTLYTSLLNYWLTGLSQCMA